MSWAYLLILGFLLPPAALPVWFRHPQPLPGFDVIALDRVSSGIQDFQRPGLLRSRRLWDAGQHLFQLS
jgi:hypothetical protein